MFCINRTDLPEDSESLSEGHKNVSHSGGGQHALQALGLIIDMYSIPAYTCFLDVFNTGQMSTTPLSMGKICLTATAKVAQLNKEVCNNDVSWHCSAPYIPKLLPKPLQVSLTSTVCNHISWVLRSCA